MRNCNENKEMERKGKNTENVIQVNSNRKAKQKLNNVKRKDKYKIVSEPF